MPGGFPGYGDLVSHAEICVGLANAVICFGFAFGFFRRPNSNKGGGLTIVFAFVSKVVVGGLAFGFKNAHELLVASAVFSFVAIVQL